jgi:DNA-binding NtrC family response regulator
MDEPTNSVLVVDDESGIRQILSRWLTAGGYDVRTAESADGALTEMARSAADVVMCDVAMPGHDGLWLAAKLHQRFPAAAILLATGLDSIPPVSSMQAGIVEYLVKPFESTNLLAAVASGVRWHQHALAHPATPPVNDVSLDDWLESTDD